MCFIMIASAPDGSSLKKSPLSIRTLPMMPARVNVAVAPAATCERSKSTPRIVLWWRRTVASGWGVTGAASEHESEGCARGVRRDGGQPHRAGDGDALAVGEPCAECSRTRSDRGACAQGAADRRESKKGRSPGCENSGPAGPDRSAVAVSGETSQRESASGPDGDPCTSRPSAGQDRAGEYRTRTGEKLRRTIARLQPAQHEPEEIRGTEPGTANRTAAIAGGAGVVERADS